jgi:hypothetical protein
VSFVIYITVEDEATAKHVVEDTKTTDSMCIVEESGSQTEFPVIDIHYNETIGDAKKD